MWSECELHSNKIKMVNKIKIYKNFEILKKHQNAMILIGNFDGLHLGHQKLFKEAKKYKVNYFIRSEESTQEPVTLPKVLEWHNKLPFKYYVNINACNPILKIETIDNFVQQFINNNCRGQFGVFEKKTFLFNNEGKMINRFFGDDKYLATLETKFVETCYEAAHSLYAGTMEDISKEIYMGSFKDQGDPSFFIMDEIECFDIDWPWQFTIAEKLYDESNNNRGRINR